MKAIKELPFIGQLYLNIEWYTVMFFRIIRHPFIYPKSINFDLSPTFNESLKFLIFGTIATYVIYYPVFHSFDFKISQTTFVLRFVFAGLIGITIIHYILRLLRSSASLKKTICVYGFVFGTSTPIYAIITMPTVLIVGPEMLFATVDDIQNPSRELVLFIENNMVTWLLYNLLQSAISVLVLIATISLLSHTHEMSKKRVFVGMSIGGIAFSAALFLVINPLLNKAQALLENFI